MPINYFVYPYVDVDGKPLEGVTQTFTFRDLAPFRCSVSGRRYAELPALSRVGPVPLVRWRRTGRAGVQAGIAIRDGRLE